MKKRVLATLMAVCMVVVGMTGCGGPASGTSSIPQEESIVEVSESYVESSAEESIMESESSYEESERGDEDYEAGGIIEEDYTEPENETADENRNDSQIIIFFENLSKYKEYIISIDVDTGSYETIASFPMKLYDGFELIFPVRTYFNNLSHYFSQDYQKMARTKIDNNTNDARAGWIDTNGNFFDVTEAVGAVPDDEFAAKKYFYTLGFSKEGYFVYVELPEWLHFSAMDDKIMASGKYYYVDPNTLDTIYEGNPIEADDLHGRDIWKNDITDWIDDECYLADIKSSAILHVGDSDYREEFVSSEARRNWSAVYGPDDQIAFLSADNSSDINTIDLALYITGRHDQNHKRIVDYSGLSEYGMEEVMKLGYHTTILDWRYKDD